MFVRKIVAVLALASAVLVPAASFAASPPACELGQHHVASVTPYRPEEHVGRATFPVLRGAQIYVPAEPGLTAEWLRLTLGRHIAGMKGAPMSDCALDLADIKVEVESSGAGFLVKIIAPDTSKGEEVLRRARLLVG